MNPFFALCFLFCTSVCSFEKGNVPQHNPESEQILYFTTSKEENGALKSSLLQQLKILFDLETFIESGTFRGNTTANAAAIFNEVYTIELFPEFYYQAIQRFRGVENISIQFGDSGDVLSKILPDCGKRILFYLDGHYDGGDRSGRGVLNTPIVAELSAIKESGKSDSLILIDDICDFQESLYPERIKDSCFEGYPNLKGLVDQILTINPHYQICFLGNALLGLPPF